MNSIVMENQFNLLLDTNAEDNEIILKGLITKQDEDEKNESDIANASVDDLSSMIVSHIMESVKEDLAKTHP
jgi:predicted DNA-binding ribbon-helix-helix protein